MDKQALLDTLEPVVGLFGDSPYIKAIFVILISVAFAKLVALILSKVIGRAVKHTGNQLDDAIITILYKPLFWTMVLIGLLSALMLLPWSAASIMTGRAIVFSLLTVLWAVFINRLLGTVTMPKTIPLPGPNITTIYLTTSPLSSSPD